MTYLNFKMPPSLSIVDHDAKPGPLDHCQICGSSDLREIIDLGYQPLCDALLDNLRQPETRYPLRLMQCEECSLAQLDYVVAGSTVYPPSYPYRAGISWPVVEAHRKMAQKLVDRFGAGKVLDIGCNDGTLLREFAALRCPIFGVEPTDVASYAPIGSTAQAFFDEELASTLRSSEGPMHLITMTNVFAHMAELGEVMRGISCLLADDGVLVIENHYLLDILEQNQFDSIYHEHIRTYTLRSLVRLFEQYGMEVFDVERVPRYGGNIRAYIGWRGKWPIHPSVGTLLAHEEAQGISSPVVWAAFRMAVLEARELFHDLIRPIPLVGCSAPGRASTLLNYFGVDSSMMEWTGEIDGSLKIGKYLPGCHVPVVSNRRLVEEQPPIVVLLAWHYAKEIAARLRREGVTSRLFVPLPTLTEIA